MKRLVYSQEAIDNIKKIYAHTKRHFSEDQARSTVGLIFEKIESLQKFPHIGKMSELSILVRELTVDGNTVFYQVTDDTIDVVYIKPRKTAK